MILVPNPNGKVFVKDNKYVVPMTIGERKRLLLLGYVAHDLIVKDKILDDDKEAVDYLFPK